MSFLLDTDICSAYLKGHQQVGSYMILHFGALYISAITAGELCTWARRARTLPKYAQAVEIFLDEIEILPVDVAVARRFGDERAKMFDAGNPVAEMDLMIAATALVHDLTLLTHNLSDYQRMPNLRVIDWIGS